MRRHTRWLIEQANKSDVVYLYQYPIGIRLSASRVSALRNPSLDKKYIIADLKNMVTGPHVYDKLAHKATLLPYTRLQAYQKRLDKLIYSDKCHIDNYNRWLSVEIECIFIDSTDVTRFAKKVRQLGHTKYVTIKDDGSIHPDNDLRNCDHDDEYDCSDDCYTEIGKEIVVNFKQNDYTVLREVLEALNSYNVYVNTSCGLHVHFDMRKLSPRKIGLMAHKVGRAVPALKEILPPSRRNNSFCKKAINRRGGDRYSFVNLDALERHDTVEIRGHSGTTNYGKIVNWINIILTIMQAKKVPKCETLGHLLTYVNFNPELKDYMLTRYAKFIIKPNQNEAHDDHIDLGAPTRNLTSNGLPF